MDTTAIQAALAEIADAMKAKGHEKATASFELRLPASHCCTVNLNTGLKWALSLRARPE